MPLRPGCAPRAKGLPSEPRPRITRAPEVRRKTVALSYVPRFVDIHCHLLPELDDGASSWEETLEMARLAIEDGISTIVATPHQLGSYAQNTGAVIRRRTDQLQKLLRRRSLPLRVLPGADVRIEPDMISKVRSGEVLTLADRGRHVLLELPHEVYLPLDGVLAKLRAAGLAGILSHPERNRGILAQPHVLEPLVEAGCLMQVTAGALLGRFGPQSEKLSRWLVEQGLVHFVSTDAHGASSRRPLLREAFQCVAQIAGQRTAVDVCCQNPARVACGGQVRLPHREPIRRGVVGWLRRNKAG